MVGSLPKSGAKPEMWVARAARTCWDESVTKSRNAGHEPSQNDFSVDQFGKAWDLTGGRRSHFGFVVFQELNKGHDQLFPDNILPSGRRQIDEVIGHHVTHPPRFVVNHGLQDGAQVRFTLFIVQSLRNGNQSVDGQEPNRVLIVRRQFTKDGYELGNEQRLRQRLAKVSQLLGGRPSHHGRVIGTEGGKRSSQVFLGGGRGFGVGGGIQGGRRGTSGEPVSGR